MSVKLDDMFLRGKIYKHQTFNQALQTVIKKNRDNNQTMILDTSSAG